MGDALEPTGRSCSTCLSLVSGEITVEETARILYHPVCEAYEQDRRDESESELWDIWESIHQAVWCTPPENQGKLVELLAAIQNLPSPTRNGEKLKVWGTPWKSLPMFSLITRENWDQGKYLRSSFSFPTF